MRQIADVGALRLGLTLGNFGREQAPRCNAALLRWYPRPSWARALTEKN